jgi:hypothetical protein
MSSESYSDGYDAACPKTVIWTAVSRQPQGKGTTHEPAVWTVSVHAGSFIFVRNDFMVLRLRRNRSHFLADTAAKRVAKVGR